MKIAIDTPKEEILKIGSECKLCGSCCRFGSGFVLEEEIPVIAASLNHDIRSFKEHFLEEIELFNTKAWKFKTVKEEGKPYGHCMFLDGNVCKIHKVKPLHCRVSTCDAEHGDAINAWFLVNHFVNPDDPESVRQYHAYIKTGGLVIEGAELEHLVPDRSRLKKILDYTLLK